MEILGKCKLKGTPFDQNQEMYILGKFLRDNISYLIILNPENNRFYEENINFAYETKFLDSSNMDITVSIREKFQDRFNQTEYKLIGFNREGRAILQDDDKQNITTYVSRLIKN